MFQHALRIPDELASRVEDARGDIPRNTWILRAMEDALAAPKKPPRASRKTRDEFAMERQAKMNAAKAGSKKR